MTRAVACTLLLLLVAPLALPAATTLQHDVPACCRAGGAHHCIAMLRPFTGADRVIAQHERCPYVHSVVLPHPARTQNDSRILSSIEEHPFLQEFVPGMHAADRYENPFDRGPPQSR